MIDTLKKTTEHKHNIYSTCIRGQPQLVIVAKSKGILVRHWIASVTLQMIAFSEFEVLGLLVVVKLFFGVELCSVFSSYENRNMCSKCV